MKTFSRIAAVLLLQAAVTVAQETRPDEQTRVYQESGRWSRQITGSMPAAKNLRVKVDSGSVRVEGGSQPNIGYSISNHSSASSEEKARKLAAWVKPLDPYAVITVEGTAITVWTALSQKGMDKKTFQQSKQATFEILDDMLGTARGTVEKNEAGA